MEGKRVLTGVKPTGKPHLGNYHGAMLPAINLSKETSDSMLFIADYHTLITVHKPKDMSAMIMEMAASWFCLLYTSPSPRDQRGSRMPSSA